MSDQRPRQRAPSRVVESKGIRRAPVYLDDDVLQRMMESFGPLDYQQFEELRDTTVAALEDARDDGESEPAASQPSPAKESLLQWFDKAVEKELKKRRDETSPATFALHPAMSAKRKSITPSQNVSKATAERIAETSASRVEISSRLVGDFTTELTDAVEKLTKAEVMCKYKEALKAAEAAMENAPPELAEKTAAAEARAFCTEVTEVSESVPGLRPIEVVGYIGVTKPTSPVAKGSPDKCSC